MPHRRPARSGHRHAHDALHADQREALGKLAPELDRRDARAFDHALDLREEGALALGDPDYAAKFDARALEVYALDTKLDVAASTAAQPSTAALETRANVMKAMQGHVLGKAVYVGLFRRPQ